MSRPRCDAGVILVALVTAMLLAGPAASAAPAGDGIVIQLLPRFEGVRVVFAGSTYRSDARGRVTVPARSTEELVAETSVPPQALAPDTRITQNRWFWDAHLGLDVHQQVTFDFTDRNGAPIEPDGLTHLLLKSSVGGLFRYEAAELDEPHWLHARRVVAQQGGLVVSPIEYGVEEVSVRGTNVVNASQQRFDPRHVHDVRIWLLYFPASFTVRDALFGFPIGSSITLGFPDGREMTVPLENGQASIASLPRGDYNVSVDGFGVTLSVPVAVSRPQEADVMFLSFFDLAAAGAAAVAFLVGLPLLGRRRRRRARLVAVEPYGERPRPAEKVTVDV